MNKKTLRQIIKENIKKVLFETKQTTCWKEVRYFHPEGKKMPNGSHYQRGGFIQECKQNANSFILDEGVHNNQDGMSGYRGGIIVFSTDVNAVELDRDKMLNKIKQIITTYKNRFNRDSIIHNIMNKSNEIDGEYIGAYSVGNFFKGKYVGDNGEESISHIINEDSINAKKRTEKNIINAFKKGKSGYHGIRTIAVFTSENPDSTKAPNDINRKNLKSLHKSLKSANYVSIPSIGQWEGEKEHPYTVINISRESAARYCGQYQQTSFVFYELVGNSTVKCEYWEKENSNLPYHPKHNNYVKKGETEEIIETPKSEDNFSKIGKDFKYSAVFESINETICKNLNVMTEKGFGGTNNTVETIMDFSINRMGQTPHIYRGYLYKGLL